MKERWHEKENRWGVSRSLISSLTWSWPAAEAGFVSSVAFHDTLKTWRVEADVTCFVTPTPGEPSQPSRSNTNPPVTSQGNQTWSLRRQKSQRVESRSELSRKKDGKDPFVLLFRAVWPGGWHLLWDISWINYKEFVNKYGELLHDGIGVHRQGCQRVLWRFMSSFFALTFIFPN